MGRNSPFNWEDGSAFHGYRQTLWKIIKANLSEMGQNSARNWGDSSVLYEYL